jgi:hypothetical protein
VNCQHSPQLTLNGCALCAQDLEADNAKLRARISELEDAIKAEMDISAARWAISENVQKQLQAANLQNGEFRKALDYAYEALKGYGCDCGTDEPGTCGECYLKAFFKEHPSEKPVDEALRSGYCHEGNHVDCPVECKNGPCGCPCHVTEKREGR